MHENIKKIFEHSRTVVIDAIKQFVASQPDKVFSLDDEQYSMFDSNNGCVMTLISMNRSLKNFNLSQKKCAFLTIIIS